MPVLPLSAKKLALSDSSTTAPTINLPIAYGVLPSGTPFAIG